MTETMTADLLRQQRDLTERINAAQALLDADALVDALTALVRIPSVYDPTDPDRNEWAVVDHIATLLDAWDMPYQRWEVAPRRPNLVAELFGTADGPILVMEGHTDVVTPGDRSVWSVDPFGADIRDGRLYGRGSCDMKGGLMAMLFAARALQQAGCVFPGTVRLAILADEEGMMLGAKSFVSQGLLNGVRAAIICEPEGDRLCVAQKGAIRVRVRFRGRMAHGCMPDEGVNPVAAMGETIAACRVLEGEILAEHPRHDLLGRFSLTPTVALGGEPAQGNVIPATATLILDIRTTPQHDHPSIVRRVGQVIEDAVGRIVGAGVEIEVLDDRPSTETDVREAIVAAVRDAHEAETGTNPSLGGVPGSTDGTIFWAATRVPIVTYGPGETTLPHQADEWVSIDEVVRYARTYIAAVLRYFDAIERQQTKGQVGAR